MRPAPKPEELCKCVENEAFQHQMILSSDCMDACVQHFGEDLSGMETWFKENCNWQENKKGEENSSPSEIAI